MDSSTDNRGGGLDVAYVAHLARLQLTDAEVATFQGQLAQVVSYVEAIGRLDLSGIEPTSHADAVHNVLRADVVTPSLPREAVLRNAPESRDGQFLVPKIVE